MIVRWSIFLRKHRRILDALWHSSLLLVFFTVAIPTEVKVLGSPDTMKLIYLALSVPITLWVAFLVSETRPASPRHLMNMFEDFSVAEKQLLQRHFQAAMKKSPGMVMSNGQAMDLLEILNFEQLVNQPTSSTDRAPSSSPTPTKSESGRKSRRGRPKSVLSDQLHCKISSEVKARLRERSVATGVPYGMIVDETLREYLADQGSYPA